MLDSEVGEALIAFGIGHGMAKQQNPYAQKISEELRIHGMVLGGNLILDELTGFIGSQMVEVINNLPTDISSLQEDELEEEIEISQEKRYV